MLALSRELRAFLNENRNYELYPVCHLALYSRLRLGEIMPVMDERLADATAHLGASRITD